MVVVAHVFNRHYLALQENRTVQRIGSENGPCNFRMSLLQGYCDMAALLAAIRGSRINEHCACLQPSTQPSFLFVVFSDLDLSLNLTGKVVKTVGDALSVTVEKSSSGEHKLTWTKVIGAGIGLLIREVAST